MNCPWTRSQLQAARGCRKTILRESGVDVRIEFDEELGGLSDCYLLKPGNGRSIALTVGQVLPLLGLIAGVALCASGLTTRHIIDMYKEVTL